MSFELSSAESRKSSVWASGFALFSMFFRGDCSLLVGKNAGAESGSALAGLSLSAVAFPFLGLAAIMLYGGDLRAFLSRLGKWPAALLFVLAMSQGPVGAMPRLVTLMHASVKPYWNVSIGVFSIFVSGSLFFTVRPSRMMHFLGVVLTPLLLATLGLLFGLGFFYGPAPLPVAEGAAHHFQQGLQRGIRRWI